MPNFYKDVPLVQANGDTHYPRTTENSVWDANNELLSTKMTDYGNRIENIERLQKAGGTATAIILANVVLADGEIKSFITSANNNGVSTTINGKALYKQGTTITPVLKSGKAVTVWYSVTKNCFFIKASAEGNVTAEYVLASKTFSNDEDTDIVGTMTDNSAVADKTLTTEGAEYVIPKGYHSGLHKVKALITGLIASVIKAGTTVGGILGTFTSDATAVDGDVLATKTYYRNGVKGTGSIPLRSIVGGQNAVSVNSIPGTIYLQPPTGYYDSTGNSSIKANDPDLISANILSDKNIFGVAGNAPRVVWGVAQGDIYPAEHSFRDAPNTEVIKAPGVGVSGLPFAPEIIIITTGYDDGNTLYQGGDYITVWKKERSNISGNVSTIAYNAKQYNPNGVALHTNDVVAASNDAYVTASSFFLPIPIYGEARWMAISTGQDEL